MAQVESTHINSLISRVNLTPNTHINFLIPLIHDSQKVDINPLMTNIHSIMTSCFHLHGIVQINLIPSS